ncbi:16389_t:CDS:2, partial [Entrophospora sp. SA101]
GCNDPGQSNCCDDNDNLSYKWTVSVSVFWLMHFDTNPVVLHELRRKLNIDTRVIRGNLVKLGEKLEDIIERPDKTK